VPYTFPAAVSQGNTVLNAGKLWISLMEIEDRGCLHRAANDVWTDLLDSHGPIDSQFQARLIKPVKPLTVRECGIARVIGRHEW
jgi:hypothetical protein